jgi:5-methylcytosine-specific restriction protein A
VEPGCPTLTSATRCDVHAPKPWATSTRRERLPRNWSSLVRLVMARDRRLCYLCGADAYAVDHVVRGDDHRLTNLAAICKRCHDAKTAAESLAGRTRR